MHAGRCEAWKWGTYSDDVYYEYDWQNSYPRIARDNGLPARLSGVIRNPSAKRLSNLSGRYCILAELECTTQKPCVPASHDGRILWPTGTFRTTLWNPEIDLLEQHGANYVVHRAWLYQREPILKDWAEWILYSLHSKAEPIEAWQRLILKHWSRALIGRFGMRYRSWEHFAVSPDFLVFMSTLITENTETTSELLQIGNDVFTSGELKEIDDGCPQVTGYIMSVARAKLWRASIAIGQANVYYMDTDSLIVDSNGHTAIQAGSDNPLFDGLRSKGRYNHIQIYGPRSIILDKRPTVAGMPKRSVEVEPRKWEGEVWRGATESIRLGESDSVRIRNSHFTMRYSDKRRAFDTDGSTIPYSLPSGTPSRKPNIRPNRYTEAVNNGYPAMLASSKATKHMPRSERTKRNGNSTVRPVP